MNSIPPGVILIAGAVVLALLPRRVRPAAFLIFPLATFWWLLQLHAGTSSSLAFLGYTLAPLRVDELSLAFGYVFTIITFLGGVYAYHLRDTGERVSTLLYAGASLGVVFAGDLFTVVVFWEIMAVSSVYLIWARRTPAARAAGMRYLIMHLFGGSLLLAGVMVQVTQTGSLAFNPMSGGTAAYLILAGFCLNAAVPPLHAWLSDAYPEGTITGSVFLSVFTTKTAVYVLARAFAGWEVLIWAGAAMAVYGVFYAILQNDIRRLLSYHIISQVGYMVAGVGLGAGMGVDGATAHAFTHILYKALLFMGAGAVLYATGRSKMTELGGLRKAMPWVLVLYMVGAFSISGVPLFSGFVSKSMVVSAAAASGASLAVVLLNLASVGTFLSVGLKLPYYTWFGRKPALPVKPVPAGMYAGMALSALLCIGIGVYPAALYNILPFPTDYHPYTWAHVLETLQLLVFAGVGFWLLMKFVRPETAQVLDLDWFYRRPAPAAYRVFVVGVSRFFGVVQGAATRLVHTLTRAAANPVKYFVPQADRGAAPQTHPAGGSGDDYDPDRSRWPVLPMVLVVLAIFVIVLGWGLLAAR